MRTANYNNNEVEVLNYNIKFSETNSPIFEEIEDDFYYPFLSFGFNDQTVMVYNNVVYFKPKDTGPQ